VVKEAQRVAVVLGIALMTVVGAGQAVDEGLRKMNLDALPPMTGGFLLWMAVLRHKWSTTNARRRRRPVTFAGSWVSVSSPGTSRQSV